MIIVLKILLQIAEVAKFIIDCISEDLQCLLEYRHLKVCKDTYLSFISKECFVIAQEKIMCCIIMI